MDGARKEATCDCLQRLSDTVRARSAKSSLIRTTCKSCGKEFVTNVETDLCYDCKKRSV
jgi:predicted Zn-ribbon and HTH transcriptional regulator